MSQVLFEAEPAAAWEDILPALARLDAVLESAIARARDAFAPAPAGEQFRGLYVSEGDVDRLMERGASQPLFADAELGHHSGSRLARLGEVCGLGAFELNVVVLALAPELDRRYERLYGYLQDNVNLRRPTVDLALSLFCETAAERIEHRACFTAGAPLASRGVVHVVPDGEHGTLPAATLKLDEQVTAFLLSASDELDPRLAPHCRLVAAAEGPGSMAGPTADGHRVLRLEGAEATPQLAGALGRDVLLFDPTGADVARLLPVFGLAAGLRGAVPCVVSSGAADSGSNVALAHFLRTWPGIAAFAGPIPGLADALPVPAFEPAFEERREQWARETAAQGIALGSAELDQLAGRLRLGGDDIRRAVANAAWRGGLSRDAVVDQDSLYAAACEISTAELAALARRRRPAARWDDLVLPAEGLAQLRELCGRVERRRRVLEAWGFERRLSMGRGTVALFAGPPGTGKTLAAEAVAAQLRLDLCTIDLSSVVSKYIGETEKNLARVFAAAERANAVLFFDEADALFGKRSEVRDAHDRYANIEISYLLQRMEQYDGVAILATNLRQNLDESFIRRIAFLVHFPFPDEASRLAIWQRIWPAETPREDGLDLEWAAREFKLSGGNIKNVALAAAFLAAEDDRPVGIAHLRQALRREFQKLGTTVPALEATVALTHIERPLVNGHARR